MDSTLLAGIIGGICTIAAVVITPMTQKYFEMKNFFPITKDRVSALNGKWNGTITQNLKEGDVKIFKVDITLEAKGKKIIGTGIINLSELYYITLEGSFRSDRFLKMDYQNTDPSIVQFGCFVFLLSENSRVLSGNFVGYGHDTGGIIFGSGEFIKA